MSKIHWLMFQKEMVYGTTTVRMNQNDEVVINVYGVNQDNSFPEGYRFLGWYNEDGIRVSKSQEYILSGVDLSVEHAYTARFEYRVEYYIKSFIQNNGQSFTTSQLYKTKWQRYNTPFDNIQGPAYFREMITHWGTEHVNHGKTNTMSDSYNSNIVAPIKVYSHNYITPSGNLTGYSVSMLMDFPGAGQITDENSGTGTSAKFRFDPVSQRYHLLLRNESEE